MRIELKKVGQGPSLAKGNNSAGTPCGPTGTNVGSGCVNAGGPPPGSSGPGVSVTYSQPTSSC